MLFYILYTNIQTFHVTGECFFTCNGASDGGIAGPVGFALIAL